MKPKISVVMSFYNDANYIGGAIESILKQNSSDFEFIIVDDGSTDESYHIVKSFSDKRIKLVKNKKNLGLTKSLNIAISKARGEYIARMDADDIALPQRFSTQLKFLETHPDYGLVGSWVQYIGPKGEKLEVKRYSKDHQDILKVILRYNPFKHPSLMIRRSILEKVGFYDEKFKYAQDYDLVLRIASISKVANIPKLLLRYRIEPEKSISFKSQKEQEKYAILARVKALKSGGFPFWYWVFFIKPLLFYFAPSPLKIFILKNLFWKLK